MDLPSEKEDEEEDLGGVDAERVCISCPDIRPSEKPDLREALYNEPVWEGLDLVERTERFEGEVLDTEPSSGGAFDQPQVIVTKETNFQIGS